MSKSFDDIIEDSGGFSTLNIFDSLNDDDKMTFLLNHMEKAYDDIFSLKQKVDYFERETDLRLTEEEIIMRKDIWSKKDVCKILDDKSEKTFERWKKSG